MKKLLCLLLIFLSFPALAQESDLLGEAVNPEANLPKSSSSKDAEKKLKSDNRFLSFFNFSFLQKKPKDSDTANSKEETEIEKLARLAEEGNLDAQLALGYSYLYGENNLSVDYEKAFRYYEKAATQNDSIALNNLGMLYYSGIGTEKSAEKAVESFTKAGELGNDAAELNLAFMYLVGSAVAKNKDTALQFFQKSADKGNRTAQFMLGYARYLGLGVAKDYALAFKLIKEAADAGYDEAQMILSQLYFNGEGSPQNYSAGAYYIKQAALQGNLNAIVQFGTLSLEGTKIPVNPVYAHIMFNLAAVKGYAGAAEKRSKAEAMLKREVLVQAQASASNFKPKISELTAYIRQTFGNDIKDMLK